MILPCDVPDPSQQLPAEAPPRTVRLSIGAYAVSSAVEGFSDLQQSTKTAATQSRHLKELASFCDAF